MTEPTHNRPLYPTQAPWQQPPAPVPYPAPPIIINNSASSSAAATALAAHGYPFRRRFNHTAHIIWGGLLTGGVWWFTGYPWCYSRWRRGH